MYTSDMVAGEGGVVDSRNLQNIPVFDKGNVGEWKKALKIALKASRRNHLGLGARPLVPWADHQLGTAPQRVQFRIDEDKWLERKDTCICAINAAVKDDSVAKEIVDQYTNGKEMLAIDHPDKGRLGK